MIEAEAAAAAAKNNKEGTFDLGTVEEEESMANWNKINWRCTFSQRFLPEFDSEFRLIGQFCRHLDLCGNRQKPRKF